MRTKRTELVVALSLIINASLPAVASDERVAITPSATPALTQHSDSTACDTKAARKGHLTRGVIKIEIDAPRSVVWNVLTDFNRYPNIFKRIKSCRVTKREGELVYTESYLKPHFFLSEPCQHTVNDLSNGPDRLKWRILDGNFKSLDGAWDLKADGNRTIATYMLEVDPGAIPGAIANMILHGMQKEVTAALKSCAEVAYVEQQRVKASRPQTAGKTDG